MNRPGNLLRFVLFCLAAFSPFSGHGQDLAGAYQRARDAANEFRRNSQSQSRPPPASAPRARDRAADEPSAAERAEAARIAKVNDLYDAARTAVQGGDAREALRLARESLGLAKDRDFKNTMKDWIQELETYIAKDEARQKANAAIASADNAFTHGDHRGALGFYRQALAADPGALTPEGKDFVVLLEADVKRSEAEARASAARKDLERKHGPQVAQLNREAEMLIETKPADALAKLEAALKLLPGDRRTVASWWWATASLALREQRFEDAAAALGKAGDNDLEPAVVNTWLQRVELERGRQGGTVQSAFAEARPRLTAFPPTNSASGLGFIESGRQARPSSEGQDKSAGDQLISAATAAGANQDLTPNFDIGTGQYAGSLPAITRPAAAERIERDPRMQAETRQLAALQSQRTKLEQQRDELVRQRDVEKTPEKMRELSAKVDEISRQYQENLVAVTKQEEVVKKTKRTIELEIVPPESPATPTEPVVPPR